MSLKFYADSALTLPVSLASPKRFLFPNKGGIKTSSLWIADTYESFCTVVAHPGDPTINLSDTSEFLGSAEIALTSGGFATATSGGQVFHYTGKTQGQLTGIINLSANILVDDKVVPLLTYRGVNGTNLEVFSSGADIVNFGVKVALGSTPLLSFPSLPAIFNQEQIDNGASSAIQLYLSVQVPAGANQEFISFQVQLNNVYRRDISDTTPYTPTEGAYSPIANLYSYRHDESLLLPIRILPINREVTPNTPGFIIGDYRWRGNSDRNATALVPTHWDIDPNAIGLEKFIAGIGDQNDLEPEGLHEVQDSIFMTIHRGEYFTGPNRYYVPADWNLEFLGASQAAANSNGTVTLHLQHTPREEAPIFVGTWALDGQGFYEKSIEYKYTATLVNPDGSDRTDLPDRYFTLDRRTNTITLNTSMPETLMFLGLSSGQSIDYFDLPIYPVDAIGTIFVSHGGSAPNTYATTWTYDQGRGTIQVPSIPGTLTNEPIYSFASPAVAVLYDAGPDDTRQIETVDFNPAFSGLAGGYFYLQHRKQTPQSLVLSSDKPRIDIPATVSSIIGLVAYGPVYFENDYALLIVTAYGALKGETIPNAKLDVVVDPNTFSGTINYQDPLTTTVSVITGGDGTANMIFIPKKGFGIWIPTIPASGGLGGVATTNIANDTLVLPDPIPLSQLWNPQEGWLVTTYTVVNNDPLFGMVGADPTLGEIPWMTTGTPGASNYKTNGERQAWRVGGTSLGSLVLPIDALDSSGHTYTSVSFDGTVKSLIYPQALPSGVTIGAYFITFLQRVLIRMHLENSNLYSNYILLQMATPDLITENPWLILNDEIQGRLDQFRLGYVRGG